MASGLCFVNVDYLGSFLQGKKLCIIQVIQFNLNLQYYIGHASFRRRVVYCFDDALVEVEEEAAEVEVAAAATAAAATVLLVAAAAAVYLSPGPAPPGEILGDLSRVESSRKKSHL